VGTGAELSSLDTVDEHGTLPDRLLCPERHSADDFERTAGRESGLWCWRVAIPSIPKGPCPELGDVLRDSTHLAAALESLNASHALVAGGGTGPAWPPAGVERSPAGAMAGLSAVQRLGARESGEGSCTSMAVNDRNVARAWPRPSSPPLRPRGGASACSYTGAPLSVPVAGCTVPNVNERVRAARCKSMSFDARRVLFVSTQGANPFHSTPPLRPRIPHRSACHTCPQLSADAVGHCAICVFHAGVRPLLSRAT